MPYNDSKGPKMESAKQERKDLLRDNPVVRDMDSSRPWMSKHFQSTMGSALKAGHEGGDSPMEGNAFTKAMADNDGNYEAAKKQLDGMSMKKMGDGPEMAYGDGPKMNHGDGPEMAYGKGPEMDYGKGPKMSALHNEGETGKENENKEPAQPQQMYHNIQRKTAPKPKQKAKSLERVKLQELKEQED